jgi:hypothetical protein
MFLRQLPALLINAAREPVFLIRLLNGSFRSAGSMRRHVRYRLEQ